jgi:gas vesicle protein
MKRKAQYNAYPKSSFFAGLLIGTAAGLTAGYLFAPGKEKEAWHPLTDQPDSAEKQKTTAKSKPVARKKSPRSSRTSVGNVEEPTGRNVSNIDDLPDRG